MRRQYTPPTTKQDRLRAAFRVLVAKGATTDELEELVIASWVALRPDNGMLWAEIRDMIQSVQAESAISASTTT